MIGKGGGAGMKRERVGDEGTEENDRETQRVNEVREREREEEMDNGRIRKENRMGKNLRES